MSKNHSIKAFLIVLKEETFRVLVLSEVLHIFNKLFTSLYQSYNIGQDTALLDMDSQNLEWNARGEELFNDWRLRDEAFKSQVEYPLQSLLTQ